MTDKQNIELGKTIKVGVKSLNEPTPQFMKTIFRTVSFLAGLWALVQHLDVGIPEDLKPKVNEWAIALLPIMHFSIKFFRWDYDIEQQD